MVESVKEIAPEFEGVVEWKEHKIKSREAIELMISLNVEKVPTICIDGKVTFVSQIPRRQNLIAAIYRRMIERVTSQSDISEHGVHQLPAVISVKKELRSFGKVVDKDVVKEWIRLLS